MKAVILAAGVGSRIGKSYPKCLTKMPNNKKILENQIDCLREEGINEIIIVVGFKKEMIQESYSNVLYCYNPIYHITNTAKSLECALKLIGKTDVIWINGDVILEKSVVREVCRHDRNIVAVNREKCNEEEVKYTTNTDGSIKEISKNVKSAEGEAVGINRIKKENLDQFIKNLEKCDNRDYYERAIEYCIKEDIRFYTADISPFKCIEIDFEEDLQKAREIFFN